MKTYRFYKEELDWFVDLPDWQGEKWELQMVMGADTFCEILSQGEKEVWVTLSSEHFENSHVLSFRERGRLEGPELGEGAWYTLEKYVVDIELEMWLCDVTKFVFGEFPQKIYFR